MNPLVSVLMTAYNREKYIAEAIESVLASTYANFELIIVDDGSEDRTVEIARSYEARDSRVRVYVNEKNLGDYPNRNKAASYATGKYIKYVDSDDLIYDFTLDVMVRYVERFPEAGFGLCTHHDHRPVPTLLSPKDIYVSSFAGLGHFNRPPIGSIIRMDAFKRLGGFSGARMIGDYEFWLKIARYYSMVSLPYDLYYYRFHEGQEQNSEYASQYDKLRYEVLNAALNHPDCPLEMEEVGSIRKVLKKQNIRNKILHLLHLIDSKLVGN
jgi:glycosyltransferase involved in cell wall biosynthesis